MDNFLRLPGGPLILSLCVYGNEYCAPTCLVAIAAGLGPEAGPMSARTAGGVPSVAVDTGPIRYSLSRTRVGREVNSIRQHQTGYCSGR